MQRPKPMRLSLITLIILTITLWTGCSEPGIPEASYCILYQPVDSLYIEWIPSGTNNRINTGFPASTVNPTLLGESLASFHSASDPDQPDNLRPSLQLDSLFVYMVSDTQSFLVYSDIDDDDWRLSFNEKENRYTYWIPIN